MATRTRSTTDLQAARVLLGRDLFTTGQASALLGVAPRTVSVWIDRGLIKGHRIPGSQDRRVYREDLVRFARDRGMRLAFETRAVSVLAPHAAPAGAVSPFRLGAMVARAEVSAVLVGCADGLAAAVALAREVRAADPGVRLTLLLGDDVPAAAVPGGVFDAVVTSAPPEAA